MDESRPRICRGGCGKLAEKAGRCMECHRNERGKIISNRHVQNAKDRFRENGYSHHSAEGILLPYVEEYCRENQIEYNVYSVGDWGIVCASLEKLNDKKFVKWLSSLFSPERKPKVVRVFRCGQIEFDPIDSAEKIFDAV